MSTETRSAPSRPQPIAQECNMCMDVVDYTYKCRICVFRSCGPCLESWWEVTPSSRYKCCGCRQYGYIRFMSIDEREELHYIRDNSDGLDIPEIPMVEPTSIKCMLLSTVLVLSIVLSSLILSRINYGEDKEFNIIMAVIVGFILIFIPFLYLVLTLIDVLEYFSLKRELSRQQERSIRGEENV